MTTKPRRAEKLSGGFPGNDEAKKEVQALAKVSRSVRGELPRVEETDVRELRKRLDVFFSDLQNESLPAINPVRGLRELIGISQTDLAATCYYSFSRWREIEGGGISVLPGTFLKIAVDLFGDSAGAVFEGAWTRFRNSLSAEARQAVERRLFPLGSGHMIP